MIWLGNFLFKNLVPRNIFIVIINLISLTFTFHLIKKKYLNMISIYFIRKIRTSQNILFAYFYTVLYYRLQCWNLIWYFMATSLTHAFYCFWQQGERKSVVMFLVGWIMVSLTLKNDKNNNFIEVNRYDDLYEN